MASSYFNPKPSKALTIKIKKGHIGAKLTLSVTNTDRRLAQTLECGLCVTKIFVSHVYMKIRVL